MTGPSGEILIDGISAFSQFGVYALNYRGLLGWAPLKEITATDWPEEDGIEVDLSSPVLDSREFELEIGVLPGGSLANFIAAISDTSYHDYTFPEIAGTYRLRLIGQPSYRTFNRAEITTLVMAEDNPLQGYTYQAPASAVGAPQGYEIDDISLSSYGLFIAAGSDDEINKMPAVKESLLIRSATTSGVTYDNAPVVFQPKDVTLNCVMRASSALEFQRNSKALLYDLIRPGKRTLFVEKAENEYPCYYKQSQITRVETIHDRIWAEMSITLVFVSFRINGEETLLATEGEEVIITEDGESFIDLQ